MKKPILIEDVEKKYYLHREAFFADNSELTLEDWDKYVQSDPELIEIEESIFKEAA